MYMYLYIIYYISNQIYVYVYSLSQIWFHISLVTDTILHIPRYFYDLILYNTIFIIFNIIFQALLFDNTYSVQNSSFVCTQLNDSKYYSVLLTIQSDCPLLTHS